MHEINYRVYENLNDLKSYLSKINSFPFDYDFLNTLRNSNSSPQKYVIIEYKDDFALFILYEIILNIFTFANLKSSFKVKIIGVPCSISKSGIYNDDFISHILEFLRNIKGLKLILNFDKLYLSKDFASGKTLPTSLLRLNFKSFNEYFSALKSNYRYRIHKARKKCCDVKMTELKKEAFTNQHYKLYLNVFEKSKFKLEKLNFIFFKDTHSIMFEYTNNNIPLAFIQLYPSNDELIFLFCGLDYTYKNIVDLYFLMILQIIEYAYNNGFKQIDLGQTTEDTKCRFGAELFTKYIYLNHSNKFFNYFFKKFSKFLEYNHKIPKYLPFKEIVCNENFANKT